jgi:glutamyl-tRNA synthetase
VKSTPSGVRFAPSPTGRFHVGNLRTAWIGAEWARILGEPWVVRFEDIDSPRVVAGAREQQLADLAALGLLPEHVLLQSERRGRHFSLFTAAVREGSLYPCTCSRKEVGESLAGLASAPHAELPIYSGHCRQLARAALPIKPAGSGVAWRFRTVDESGHHDFIVARTSDVVADEPSFVPAYHWACAIDDYDGNYRLLVRAWDLATSTPLQREIQAWIARNTGGEARVPAVFHTSLIVQNDGQRLEKRTAGVTLEELREQGRNSAWILAQFRASFAADRVFPAAGTVLGELRHEISLSELGF